MDSVFYTSFTAPLTKSAEVIEQRRFQQADIIFVTDGEAYVNDEYLRYWNELKKEKGFSVLSLLLGTESTLGVQGFL